MSCAHSLMPFAESSLGFAQSSARATKTGTAAFSLPTSRLSTLFRRDLRRLAGSKTPVRWFYSPKARPRTRLGTNCCSCRRSPLQSRPVSPQGAPSLDVQVTSFSFSVPLSPLAALCWLAEGAHILHRATCSPSVTHRSSHFDMPSFSCLANALLVFIAHEQLSNLLGTAA